MRQIRAFLLRLRGLLWRSRRDQEITDELESNIAFHTEDNIRSGMHPEEARRDALLRFGCLESIKQDCRDRAGLPFIEIPLRPPLRRPVARQEPHFHGRCRGNAWRSASAQAPPCLRLHRRCFSVPYRMPSRIVWSGYPRLTVSNLPLAPTSRLRTLPNGSAETRSSPAWPLTGHRRKRQGPLSISS